MTPIRLIRLPWPTYIKGPNGSHGRWFQHSKAAKAYKKQCVDACKAQAVQPMDCEAVVVGVTFYPPTLRRYDLDNIRIRAKVGFDAVAEAIGVDDGKWHTEFQERGEKVKGGAILVELTPAEAPTKRPYDYSARLGAILEAGQ